jgi:hypothetical protein
MLDIDLTPGRNDPAFKQAVKLVTACCTSHDAVNSELSGIVSGIMNEAGTNPDEAAQRIASLTYNLAIFGATAAVEIASLDDLARRGRLSATQRDPFGWINKVAADVGRERR